MNDLSEFTRISAEEAAGNLRASLVRLMAVYWRKVRGENQLAEALTLRSIPVQVDEITARLDPSASRNGPQKVERFANGNNGAERRLPDPYLIAKMIRVRRLRERFFDSRLFSDPAWDMLLELTSGYAEDRPLTVSSLCDASGLPMATALRRIDEMVESGLIERKRDHLDRRRIFVVPTEKAIEAISGFFAELETSTCLV
ncbi:MarR family transcriptional regulator [Parasphingopyxis sp. CP4]|uniref:MarR family winged helix-turn-helix transcriptional regulator n=1 Tax=Parasphingopyxis sp. CP4 TaxID=2724527 RepID=UPI0015A1E564|nr:helix-turn-helix domain-containing protein [Parasphingopyxis sp. CP4]QLC22422.1 MarR family transcriptional regulator [Parasphingopyxis sp. CP4]